MAEQKTIEQEMADLTGQIRDYSDRMSGEIKKYGTELGDTKETLAKLNAKMDELEQISERLAKVEAKQDKPGASEVQTKTDDVQSKAFARYLRKGENALSPDEQKSLWTGDDTHGGYLVPQNLASEILSLSLDISDIRSIAKVVTISVGDTYEEPAATGAFAGGHISELATPTETAHKTFAMLKTPVHELYANPWATQKMLEDTGFNVEKWVAGEIAQTKAQLEGQDFVSGNGVGEPEGILTNASVLLNTTNSGTAATLLDANGQVNGLITASYALREVYSRNARWLMRRASVGTIRAAKDTQMNYVWQPMAAGQPATLLGYPIQECPDWPAVGANAYAAAFGDFQQGYQIVDRLGATLLRDPLTHKPFIEMYYRWRVGGQVRNAEAIRLVVCHV